MPIRFLWVFQTLNFLVRVVLRMSPSSVLYSTNCSPLIGNGGSRRHFVPRFCQYFENLFIILVFNTEWILSDFSTFSSIQTRQDRVDKFKTKIALKHWSWIEKLAVASVLIHFRLCFRGNRKIRRRTIRRGQFSEFIFSVGGQSSPSPSDHPTDCI